VGDLHRYAALLRGIAPSGKNMTNDKLRRVFEGLGFEGVSSVLSSGNIVFHSAATDVPALENRVEAALTSELGLSSRTIIRAHPDLRALVDSDPFPGLTHGRGTYLTATFLKDVAPRTTTVPGESDRLAHSVRYDPGARVVLAVIDTSDPGRASGFMASLEKAYGREITTRSWLTVQRIVRKLES
jgi:uncharacterized protein (DUF1697 family)